jgi:hypothetical protein
METMRIDYTVFDAVTGKVLGTGYSPVEWESKDPNRKMVWGVAARPDQRVDPTTGTVVSKLPLLAQLNYTTAVAVPLVLNFPVTVLVHYEGENIGVLAPGGDSLVWSDAGTYALRLEDASGLYLPSEITVVVT